MNAIDPPDNGPSWRGFDLAFGPLRITADEQRQAPIPHRYVTGRLDGSDTEMSVYLPTVTAAAPRMLHLLGPGPGGVTNTVNSGPQAAEVRSGVDFPAPRLAFVRACDAFLVESNQGFQAGGPRPADPSIVSHRANAAVARAAAQVAHDHYGAWPEHAYVFGGSGGGMRTLLALQEVEGLWSGGVPYFIGIPGPDTNGAISNVRRLLEDNLDTLVALADGGTVSGLDDEAIRSLAVLEDLGSPRAALGGLRAAGTDLGISLRLFADDDLEEYARSPDASTEQTKAKLRIGEAVLLSTVAAHDLRELNTPDLDCLVHRKLQTGFVADGTIVGLRLDVDCPLHELIGATLSVTTTEGERTTTVLAVANDVLVIEIASGSLPLVADLSSAHPGDTVRFDNRKYLAFTAGSADRLAALPAPSPTGLFHGRIIHLNALHDYLALPGRVMGLARRIRDQNPEAHRDRYRLWFLDHASHYPPSLASPGLRPSIVTAHVSTEGALERAIVELIRWVEDDIEPTEGVTADDLDRFDPAHSPADLAASFQPRVTLDVAASPSPHAMTLIARAHIPHGSATIIGIDWDIDGSGTWTTGTIHKHGPTTVSKLELPRTQTTRRVTVRARSRAAAALDESSCLVDNLAHVTLSTDPQARPA